MPARKINVTPQMDRLLDDNGNEARLEALRTAVQAGIDSGIAKGDVIGKIRARIGRRAEAETA